MPESTAPDAVSFFWMFVFPVVLLLAFMILPQRSRKKKQQTMINNLRPKDKVVTHSGIIGIVEKIDKDKITLRVDEKTKIEFLKEAVARLIKDQN